MAATMGEEPASAGATLRRPRVVLDCDPGHDDAVAILVAARLTDLVAITTVSGNAPVAATTANALAVAELIGCTVPVSPGADRPLVAEPWHAAGIHGPGGLRGTHLPPPTRRPDRLTAAERLLVESRHADPLWIVATGPLTNVALALRADPSLAARLAGISVMGGGLAFGNTTPAAEFNIWADPEAADVVLRSGARLLLCPLDVTHQVLADRAYADSLRALGTPVGAFLGDLVDGFIDGYLRVFFDQPVAPMHDVCAVLALARPELFTFEDLHVQVETGRGAGRGATIADRRGVRSDLAPNARVAVTARGDEVLGEIRRAAIGR